MSHSVGSDPTGSLEGIDMKQEIEVGDAGVSVLAHLGQFGGLHPYQLGRVGRAKSKAGLFEQFAAQRLQQILSGLDAPSRSNPHRPTTVDAML